MHKPFTFLAFVGLSTLASAVKFPYCQGEYEINKKHCEKFGFVSNVEPCEELTNCTTFFNIESFPNQKIDDHTAKMAQLITNVFENGNTIMGYAYVQALGDGRGFTSGYAGFTSGTNDAYAVVKEYVNRKPKDNILEPYLSELARISALPFCDTHRNDTQNLQQYYYDWTTASCSDPIFVQTQLDVGQSMYLYPSVKFAAAYGIHSDLGKAFFYDTIIQHGWQYIEPLINIYRILILTGPRHKHEPEKHYLARFLKTRRQLLCCFPDDVWPPSADRVSDLQLLLEDWERNKDLKHPVHLKAYNYTVYGTEQMVYDTAECPTQANPTQTTVPKGWELPASTALPIPDKC